MIHHAHGGETSLRDVVGLCWFHHRCVHEGGWSIEATDDRFRFRQPDGTVIEPVPQAPIDPTDGGIRRRNHDRGLEIAADTVTTNWCGDPLDVPLATSNLMYARDRARRQAPPPTGMEDPPAARRGRQSQGGSNFLRSPSGIGCGSWVPGLTLTYVSVPTQTGRSSTVAV